MGINDYSSELMKIKIISNGRIHDTRIINAETGEMIPVTAFSIVGDAHTGQIVATITIPHIACEIVMDAEVKVKEV